MPSSQVHRDLDFISEYTDVVVTLPEEIQLFRSEIFRLDEKAQSILREVKCTLMKLSYLSSQIMIINYKKEYRRETRRRLHWEKLYHQHLVKKLQQREEKMCSVDFKLEEIKERDSDSKSDSQDTVSLRDTGEINGLNEEENTECLPLSSDVAFNMSPSHQDLSPYLDQENQPSEVIVRSPFNDKSIEDSSQYDENSSSIQSPTVSESCDLFSPCPNDNEVESAKVDKYTSTQITRRFHPYKFQLPSSIDGPYLSETTSPISMESITPSFSSTGVPDISYLTTSSNGSNSVGSWDDNASPGLSSESSKEFKNCKRACSLDSHIDNKNSDTFSTLLPRERRSQSVPPICYLYRNQEPSKCGHNTELELKNYQPKSCEKIYYRRDTSSGSIASSVSPETTDRGEDHDEDIQHQLYQEAVVREDQTICKKTKCVKTTNKNKWSARKTHLSKSKKKLPFGKIRNEMKMQREMYYTQKEAKKIERGTREAMQLLREMKRTLEGRDEHLTRDSKILLCDHKDKKTEAKRVRRYQNVRSLCRHSVWRRRNRIMRRKRGKAIFRSRMLKQNDIENKNKNTLDNEKEVTMADTEEANQMVPAKITVNYTVEEELSQYATQNEYRGKRCKVRNDDEISVFQSENQTDVPEMWEENKVYNEWAVSNNLFTDDGRQVIFSTEDNEYIIIPEGQEDLNIKEGYYVRHLLLQQQQEQQQDDDSNGNGDSDGDDYPNHHDDDEMSHAYSSEETETDDDDIDFEENADKLDMADVVFFLLKTKKRLLELQGEYETARALAPYATMTDLNFGGSSIRMREERAKMCEKYFEELSVLLSSVREIEDKKLELVRFINSQCHNDLARLQILHEISVNHVEEPEPVPQEPEVRSENNNTNRNVGKRKKRRIDGDEQDVDSEKKKKKYINQPQRKPTVYASLTAQPRKKLPSKAVVKNIGKTNKSNKCKEKASKSKDEKNNSNSSEILYCLCKQVSYGDMIGCDNENCIYEWYHFACVNLNSKPKGKWYCPFCRADKPTIMKPKEQLQKEKEQHLKDKEREKEEKTLNKR